jgi:hypothetical protein
MRTHRTRRITREDVGATKLTNMRIDEISGVDLPANGTEGWLFMKAARQGVVILGADPVTGEAADHPAPVEADPPASANRKLPKWATDLRDYIDGKDHRTAVEKAEDPNRQLTRAEVCDAIAKWGTDLEAHIQAYVREQFGLERK